MPAVEALRKSRANTKVRKSHVGQPRKSRSPGRIRPGSTRIAAGCIDRLGTETRADECVRRYVISVSPRLSGERRSPLWLRPIGQARTLILSASPCAPPPSSAWDVLRKPSSPFSQTKSRAPKNRAGVWACPPRPIRRDVILLFGGDGTIHRHLGPLVKLGLPVLIVPAGSGNDFARALGLRRVRDSLAAWQKFCGGAGNIRAIDLGLITPLEAESWCVADSAGARRSPLATSAAWQASDSMAKFRAAPIASRDGCAATAAMCSVWRPRSSPSPRYP